MTTKRWNKFIPTSLDGRYRDKTAPGGCSFEDNCHQHGALSGQNCHQEGVFLRQLTPGGCVVDKLTPGWCNFEAKTVTITVCFEGKAVTRGVHFEAKTVTSTVCLEDNYLL